MDVFAADSLVPIAVGFLLTTVLGGSLGFYFQQRTWNHQHAVQRREQRHEQAIRVFEELSRLMDRRLYRLRLLYWSRAASVRSLWNWEESSRSFGWPGPSHRPFR
jgi:uncharacterized membrane protein